MTPIHASVIYQILESTESAELISNKEKFEWTNLSRKG